ncbi:hypothetical protein WJX82_002901 [Trebouxia sp. C0006]
MKVSVTPLLHCTAWSQTKERAMPKGRAAPLPRTAQSRKPASGARSQSVKGLCKACWTTDSPQWRKGPDDYDELCNACGTKCGRCVKQTNAKGWADYVSRKRTAQNHHLQLKYHHERQLESLTRLLNCQEQLSSQQPRAPYPQSEALLTQQKAYQVQ